MRIITGNMHVELFDPPWRSHPTLFEEESTKRKLGLVKME